MTDIDAAISVLRSAGFTVWEPSEEELRWREWIKRNTDLQLWTWRPRAEDAR